MKCSSPFLLLGAGAFFYFHKPQTTGSAAAPAIQEKVVGDQLDYAPAWSRLGVIDAGLGRKDDAVREGRRACGLLPLSKDAFDGSSFVTNLAIIYGWTGDKDSALEQLAISAQVPA